MAWSGFLKPSDLTAESEATVRAFDPHRVPVVAVDGHLRAVNARSLTPDRLRRAIPLAINVLPEITGDGRVLNRPVRAASVLIPLLVQPNGLRLLLTRRNPELRHHAGQISFPGGRAESFDQDAIDTALREAEEEIGLSRNFIEVLGELPAYTTVTAFRVTPVVALVHPGYSLVADHSEVAEIFDLPLDFVLNPAHHRWHELESSGNSRRFLSMPWKTDEIDKSSTEYFIWGATAAMLRNLYRVLADLES